jgi:hypothetical protein
MRPLDVERVHELTELCSHLVDGELTLQAIAAARSALVVCDHTEARRENGDLGLPVTRDPIQATHENERVAAA